MSDPRDEDFLKEITDMLDRPAPSSSREPPSAQRRRKKRRRFPFLAVWTVLLAGALLFACYRYMQSRGSSLSHWRNPPPLARRETEIP